MSHGFAISTGTENRGKEVHTWIRYGQALGMLQSIVDQQELRAVVQYYASTRLSLLGLMDLPWMGYLFLFVGASRTGLMDTSPVTRA